MKKVQLKNYSKEALKTKMLMLKSSQLFDDNILKMIEIASSNKISIELDDKQVEFVKDMQMVELIEREQDEDVAMPDLSSNITAQQNDSSNNKIDDKSRVEDLSVEHTEEDINAETQEQNEEKPQEQSENQEQVQEQNQEEVDVNINIDKEKSQEEPAATEPQEFMPDPEKIKELPAEKVEKMYYLTPERVFESFKRINGGIVWERLGKTQDGPKLQLAIENAYKRCNWVSELMHPNFLDDRLSESLAMDNQTIHMRELHMAALLGTYVGYHVEQNESEVSSAESTEPKKSNIAVLKFPTLVSEIPGNLKDSIKGDLSAMLEHRIEELMNTSNSYGALVSLLPLEEKIDEELENYSEGLHTTENNKIVRAYIKTIRKDLVDEMGNKLANLNVNLDLYGINWNDQAQRRNVIGIIEQIQGNGSAINISNFIQEINMSFTVNSRNDLNAVACACKDLSKLSEQGIHVNLAFDLSTEAMMDLELQEQLNNIVNSYDNITRDTATELPSNIMNAAVEQSISAPLGHPRRMPGVQMDPRRRAITQLTMGAVAMGNFIEHVVEGPEIHRNTSGGGNP